MIFQEFSPSGVVRMGVGRAAQALWLLYLGWPHLVSSFSSYFTGSSGLRGPRLNSLRPGDADSLWTPVADSVGAAAPAVTRGSSIDTFFKPDRRDPKKLQSIPPTPSVSDSPRVSSMSAKVSSPALPLALAAQALINELGSLRVNGRRQRTAQNNAVTIQWSNATGGSSSVGIAPEFAPDPSARVPTSRLHLQEGLRSVRLEVPLGGVASGLDWLRVVAGVDRSDPSLFPKVYLRNPHAKPSDDQTDDSQTNTDNLFKSDADEDLSKRSSSSQRSINCNHRLRSSRDGGSHGGNSGSLLASGPMRAFEHAGLGAAHAVCGAGPTTAQAWEAMTAIAPPGGRFFGGERFDHGEEFAATVSGTSRAPTSEVPARSEGNNGGESLFESASTASTSCNTGSPWTAFGGHTYVLPLVEVVGSSEETVLAVNLVWDEQESGEKSYDDTAEEEDGATERRRQGVTTGLSFADARARAVDLLRQLPAAQSAAANPPPTRRQPPPLSKAASSGSGNDEGVAGKEEEKQWAGAVNGALADIAGGAYEKVVLARQRRVELGAPADPLELCAALREDHGNLFLFELDEQRDLTLGVTGGSSSSSSCSSSSGMAPQFGSHRRFERASPVAFLGCTPELLFACNEARGEVVTVAIAGTRPRGADADTDAQLGEDLMASAKVCFVTTGDSY